MQLSSLSGDLISTQIDYFFNLVPQILRFFNATVKVVLFILSSRIVCIRIEVNDAALIRLKYLLVLSLMILICCIQLFLNQTVILMELMSENDLFVRRVINALISLLYVKLN